MQEKKIRSRFNLDYKKVKIFLSEILLKIGRLKNRRVLFHQCPYIKGICEMENQESANYTYILRCKDDSLYTGWTNNLEKRIQNHNAGKGAKYTRARRRWNWSIMKDF